MKLSSLLPVLPSLLLAACTTLSGVTQPTAQLQAAAIEGEPLKPVQIVEIPKPLPLPGQLQQKPAKDKPEPPIPTERVDVANKKATLEPTSHGYLNAIQVYPFVEGALYQLYATPERVSDITLQPGETLTAISAGDTARWVIGDTQSGIDAQQRKHVLVKPLAPNLKTNLVITTNKRAYHLLLESTTKTFMAALSWTYPHDDLAALQRQNEEVERKEPIASALSLDNLNFHYEISGDFPNWRPIRAFDDSHKVYIEFPKRIDQSEAPPLFVISSTGENELINYRMRSSYYIVDRLFAAAELRLGKDPQQVVRITRTNQEGSK